MSIIVSTLHECRVGQMVPSQAINSSLNVVTIRIPMTPDIDTSKAHDGSYDSEEFRRYLASLNKYDEHTFMRAAVDGVTMWKRIA